MKVPPPPKGLRIRPRSFDIGDDVDDALVEERWKKGQQLTKEDVLEGILASVSNVNTLYKRNSNRVMGPGGASWYEFSGIKTTFVLKYEEKEREMKYEGVIMPDSIGNQVKVYLNDDAVVKIHDTKLDRWYSHSKE